MNIAINTVWYSDGFAISIFGDKNFLLSLSTICIIGGLGQQRNCLFHKQSFY